MAPDTLLGVGVNKGCLGIHELSRMTDSHVPQKIDVAAPLIGKDQSFGIAVSLNNRNECVLRAIGNNLQETLPRLSRDTSENPLLTEHALVPLRHTGERVGSESYGHSSQDSIHLLAGATMYLENICEVCSRYSAPETEELQSHPPLLITELAAAL